MLAKRWREHGDSQAAHKLVTSHLRLVAKIAMGYRGYGLPIGEVISEGNVGLMQAVKKFDPDKGTRFVTYAAYWIRAFILNHVIKSWSMVGSGSGPLRSKMFFRLRREKARIGQMAEEAQGALDALARAVEDPSRALAERHAAELRMLAVPVQIDRREPQRRKALQALGTQFPKAVQQLAETLAFGRLELSKSIEGRKRHGLAMSQEMLHAGQPIRPLAVDQVSDHVIRAPGTRAFRARDPAGREIAEQRVQTHRRP